MSLVIERYDGQTVDVVVDGEPVGHIICSIRSDDRAMRLIINCERRVEFFRPGWKERQQARHEAQMREVEQWTPPDPE